MESYTYNFLCGPTVPIIYEGYWGKTVNLTFFLREIKVTNFLH